MAKKMLERLGNSKTRTLALLGVFVLLAVILIIIFTARKPSPLKTDESHSSKIPQITAIPGNVTSEKYQSLQEEDNRRRAEQARKTGGSAVATIIGSRDKDLLSKRESFGIEGEFLKASECSCPPKENEIPNLDPALAKQLISQIEADPNNALKLLQQHPGLAKALCKQKPNLALKIIENNKEAAKIMLNECPTMAKLLAEKNPALFKQLMLENPDLAKKIADTDPNLLKELMEKDPDFARQFAKANPDVTKALMKKDANFANKMALANPDAFKELMVNDPEFAKLMSKTNPDMVKTLMKNDPEFANKMSIINSDMVKSLMTNDPLFAKAMAANNLNTLLKKSPFPIPDSSKQARETVQLNELQQKQIAAIMTNMEAQSKSAFQAWGEITPQVFVQGDKKEEKEQGKGTPSGSTGSQGEGGGQSGNVLIKAGSILFAVLDTAVNSDEPGPVMATVVQGPFKGSKLVGDVQLANQPGGSGNRPEKVILNFSTLNVPDISKSLTIKGVAIDPDTARTALATDVDHHYLLRYGTLFASSFMAGYSKVITSEGSVQTNVTGNTTTTVTPQLSGRKEVFAALGEVGKRFGDATSTYFNSPNTITVDAGTGLGLLILTDVTNSSE